LSKPAARRRDWFDAVLGTDEKPERKLGKVNLLHVTMSLEEMMNT